MSLSKEEVAKLPTILEVLNEVSAQENRGIPAFDDAFVFEHRMWEDGYYYPVSLIKDRTKVILMPCSQASPAVYYRGENKENLPCKPSLLRPQYEDETERIVARIKAEEFKMVVMSHPVVRFLQDKKRIVINAEAICQHYGFATQMLDLTNNKWTAAFFATSRWDKDKNRYYPVDSNFEKGYGVFYVSRDSNKITDSLFNEKLFPIGFQLMKRPSSQNAFGFHMEKEEDFSQLDYFEPIRFRHSIEASQIVFSMSYKQNKYYPEDYIADYANQILASKKVSEASVMRVLEKYYLDKDVQFVEDALKKKSICVDDSPIVCELKERFEKDWRYWKREGILRLYNNILQPRMICSDF